ncbi:hypothetical protein CGI98_18305 [Vibrio parahaemolyticus]|nr:hypothetical protein CGI97_21720 [Vibrio parahaemolyticus]TOG70033.1 hypothetical protein CGI98_18305 [Vibrio parahaemolyticus]
MKNGGQVVAIFFEFVISVRLCDGVFHHIGENNARVVYCLSGSLLRLVRNAARSRIDNCSAKQ